MDEIKKMLQLSPFQSKTKHHQYKDLQHQIPVCRLAQILD